jgi:hypothetical protein
MTLTPTTARTQRCRRPPVTNVQAVDVPTNVHLFDDDGACASNGVPQVHHIAPRSSCTRMRVYTARPQFCRGDECAVGSLGHNSHQTQRGAEMHSCCRRARQQFVPATSGACDLLASSGERVPCSDPGDLRAHGRRVIVTGVPLRNYSQWTLDCTSNLVCWGASSLVAFQGVGLPFRAAVPPMSDSSTTPLARGVCAGAPRWLRSGASTPLQAAVNVAQDSRSRSPTSEVPARANPILPRLARAQGVAQPLWPSSTSVFQLLQASVFNSLACKARQPSPRRSSQPSCLARNIAPSAPT